MVKENRQTLLATPSHTPHQLLIRELIWQSAMGFRVLVGDPISGGVRASVPIIPRTVNVTDAGGMSNDTSVFPVALLENAVTRGLHIKAKKRAVHPKRSADEVPIPMNCLCSTCGLILIPGGWSAIQYIKPLADQTIKLPSGELFQRDLCHRRLANRNSQGVDRHTGVKRQHK